MNFFYFMVLLTLNLLATFVGASDDEDVGGTGGEEGSGDGRGRSGAEDIICG